ncbi:hypothetical protein Nepgr_014953 [Nepenthes gracilis]|uniref:Uncharacterized protein n=1 Tax=Nepenthes gracilis TaxID=150966 RepID=A0AAD3SM91_NEPGR|nr:hypothetical protein Nepgr_014953 [Nepenthes gracilis]
METDTQALEQVIEKSQEINLREQEREEVKTATDEDSSELQDCSKDKTIEPPAAEEEEEKSDKQEFSMCEVEQPASKVIEKQPKERPIVETIKEKVEVAPETVDVPKSIEVKEKQEKTLEASAVTEPDPELLKEREASQTDPREEKELEKQSEVSEIANLPKLSTQEAIENPKETPEASSVKEPELEEVVKDIESSQVETIEEEKAKEPWEKLEANPVKDVEYEPEVSEKKESAQAEGLAEGEKPEPGSHVGEAKEPPEEKETVDVHGSTVHAAETLEEESEANPVKEPEQEAVQEAEILKEDLKKRKKLEPGFQVEENLQEKSKPTKTKIEEELSKANQEQELEKEEVIVLAKSVEEEKPDPPTTDVPESAAKPTEKLKETTDETPVEEPGQEVVKEKEASQTELTEEETLEQYPQVEEVPKQHDKIAAVEKKREEVEPVEKDIATLAQDDQERQIESQKPPLSESSKEVVPIHRETQAEKVGKVDNGDESKDTKTEEERLEKNPLTDESARQEAERVEAESIPVAAEEVTSEMAAIEESKELETRGENTAIFESIKDGDEEQKSEDQPKEEAPEKPTSKHSNNILSKMKQSLIKAKKAIIGKSSQSKTISSESKGDAKVK